MCRLLAFVGAGPTTLAEVLGEALGSFVDLSCGLHGDGWGMAWPEGGEVSLRKAPVAAATSDDFAALAGSLRTDALLVHLRWATLDLAVTQDNTHPFGDDAMAFAHNGSVSSADGLDALIDPVVAAARRGSTDSERLFLAVKSMAARTDPATALVHTVATVAATLPHTSLNCMLMTPERLYAVCRYDPATVTEELGGDYYDLYYRASPEAVVVASTGWPQAGWQRVHNGEMLVVERWSLETAVVPLDGR